MVQVLISQHGGLINCLVIKSRPLSGAVGTATNHVCPATDPVAELLSLNQ